MMQHGARSRDQKRAPERTAPCSVLLLTSIAVFAVAPVQASAQQPTASQVQQALQQQPGLGDMVRSRISQSGLTADEIRARLSASGYPSTLLDAYLASGTTAWSGAPAPDAQELAALQALGLPSQPTPLLPYDTGLVRAVRTGPPSDVFGVDVFQ